MLNTVMTTFNSFDLLSVFTQDKNSSYYTEEIDEAILNSILKAKQHVEKSRDAKKAQLNLALTLDRCDIARKSIVGDDNLTWETEYMHELMYMAIDQNKLDFVELFLENGFILNKFLTYRCLIKLYNDVNIICIFIHHYLY